MEFELPASPKIRDYYSQILSSLEKVYSIAGEARKKGLDPREDVEIKLAQDLADRVEGLVGPPGVAKDVKEYSKTMSRKDVVMNIVKNILSGKYSQVSGGKSEEKLAEQAIRTGLALLTEGVVAAPIEGISKVTIDENPDGSRYLSVYYAGPIRSAGGTAQAVSVVIADYVRKSLKLDKFQPTQTEIERYVEEVNLYHNAVSRLQYKPSDDEVRFIIQNCPVCITGDPTSDVEVDAYKDLERIETNRVRGGMCLVIGEGIAQKAKKLVKYADKFGLDWDWLSSLVKVEKREASKIEIKPNFKYLSEIVAGRPIFAYPSTIGGFRLRYGRGRNTGLMAKAIHPATMVILDGFPAIGTQMKIERPGKGCTLTTNDRIRGPVVRLKDGSVVWVESTEIAEKIKKEIAEILFIGDILISFGDFLKSNQRILPSPYVEEWWVQELEQKGGRCNDPFSVSFDEAVDLSERYDIPLHPRYVFAYNEVSVDELKALVKWLCSGMGVSSEKRILEKLLVPHSIVDGRVEIQEPYKMALFKTLAIPDSEKVVDRIDTNDPIEFVNELSPYEIRPFSTFYIGGRMGRPEKARERKMSPPPHLLFPVGYYGGQTRSLLRAAEEKNISVEMINLFCPECKEERFSYKCEVCGSRTVPLAVCPKCGMTLKSDVCPKCKVHGVRYKKRQVPLGRLLDEAISRVGRPGGKLKGVIGTTSAEKSFEPIEKGIIRSRHGVFVFKDGTIRFDATNLPLTHFKPREIGTSIEKLRELGYTVDYLGNPLERDDQIVELFPQDVIVSVKAGEYLLKVSRFVDDLLQVFYGLDPYYNANKAGDLVGHLIIGLAPHTSAGVLGRIVGFTKANAWYAHPYFHAATRRDCDGDENACMLALDALLNFSREFLPSTRGGRMDAPLVLTTILDPTQVDDQVHEMEVIGVYPLDFYLASQELPSPYSIKMELVRDRLGKDNQYDGFSFSLDTSDINLGNYKSAYTQMENMMDKVYAQLNLGKKLRAVDERDEAKKILDFHFLRDIYGNLRSFGEQQFRCISCNTKYRRPPLKGICLKCGGRLVLTVSEGSVRKYLEVSKKIASEFNLSDYANQRLALVEGNIDSVFKNEKVKQFSITDFM